jgi:hypothetical protein
LKRFELADKKVTNAYEGTVYELYQRCQTDGVYIILHGMGHVLPLYLVWRVHETFGISELEVVVVIK